MDSIKINSFLKKQTNGNQNVVFYKIMHVLFGLNFGFFDSSNNKLRVKNCILFSSLSTCVCVITLNVYYFRAIEIAWFNIYYATEQIFYILIFYRTKYTMSNFFRTLINIDTKLNEPINKTKFENRYLNITLWVIIGKAIVFVGWCYVCEIYQGPIWASTVYFILWICHDFIAVTNSLVFFSVYLRLKSLSCQLETASTGYESFNKIYKSIVDAAESIKNSFDAFVSSAKVIGFAYTLVII